VIKHVKDILNSNINTTIVKDAEIAYWIRKIGHGDTLEKLPYFKTSNGNRVFVELNENNTKRLIKENILKDLVRIAYLFLGSEVTRHPSSLEYNNIVLDLIENGKISWHEAIVNKDDRSSGVLMPMSMKDSVIAARSLRNNYNQFIPISIRYRYDRHFYQQNAKIKELIEKEYVIMLKRLRWRYLVKYKKDFEHKFIFDDNEMRKAIDLIEELLKKRE
jgi:hypothetical protein